MLSPDDALLVRQDSALPGLAALLDADQFLALLQPELSLEWPQLHLEPHYIRYKPATSCLVGFRGTYAGNPVSLYARLHHPSQGEKAAKPLQRPLAASVLGPGALLLSQSCLLVMIFPNDHELRVLPELMQPPCRDQYLGRLMAPGDPHLGSEMRPLRYKPERRFVAQIRLKDGRQFLLKAHDRRWEKEQRASSNDFIHDAGNPEALTQQDAMLLRPRLAQALQHRLALYPWIEGHPLSTAQSPQLLERAGNLLARLHRWNQLSPPSPPRSVQSTTPSLQPLVETALQTLAVLAPSQRQRVRSLADRLLAAWYAQPACLRAITCRIHGDCSADQLILSGDQIWFIDFDRTTYSHPVHDLGSFLARLHYESLATPGRGADPSLAADGLVQGYLQASPWPLAPLIQPSLALHLLQLASEPFRQRQPHWLGRLDQVLCRIEQILTGDSRAL